MPIEKYGKTPNFSGKQHFYSYFQNSSENSDYLMINLHKIMGPDWDQTCDPWICSQTRICCQTRYQLRYYIVSLSVSGSFILTFCRLGNFFRFLFRLLIFFKINFFRKSFKNMIRVSTVWIQIRPDILSGLTWIQTVCNNYQQTTLGDIVLILMPFTDQFFQEILYSDKAVHVGRAGVWK